MALTMAWHFGHRQGEDSGYFGAAPTEGSIPPRPRGGDDEEGSSPALLATWLGGPNADAVGGVAIAPDGSLLVGATQPGVDPAFWKPELFRGTETGSSSASRRMGGVCSPWCAAPAPWTISGSMPRATSI